MVNIYLWGRFLFQLGYSHVRCVYFFQEIYFRVCLSFLRRLLFPWCTPKNLSLSQLSEKDEFCNVVSDHTKSSSLFSPCLGLNSPMETIEGTISPQRSWLHMVSIPRVHFIQLSFPLVLLYLFWTLSNLLIFLTSFLLFGQCNCLSCGFHLYYSHFLTMSVH